MFSRIFPQLVHMYFCVQNHLCDKTVNVSKAGTGSYSFSLFPLRTVIKNTGEQEGRFWHVPFLVGDVPASWPWLSCVTLLGLTLLHCQVGILQSTWHGWREDSKHSLSCHCPLHWAHLTSQLSFTGGQAACPLAVSWKSAKCVLVRRLGALGSEGHLRSWGKPLIAWTQHRTHEPRWGHYPHFAEEETEARKDFFFFFNDSPKNTTPILTETRLDS